MAQFINTRTGVVIDVNSQICGGDWKPVQESKPAKNKETVPKMPVVKKESKK